MKTYKILLISILSVCGLSSAAAVSQTDSIRSRRSSLCSIMVKHMEDKYAKEIEEQFLEIPIDEKFNDHNLSVRVAYVNGQKPSTSEINKFVEDNHIASRMVGRWFNRNKFTGECNLDLIKTRGLYDASAMDFELASKSVLGKAALEDAGEDLIGHTYLMVNDITYIDKGKRSSIWGGVAGALLMAGAMYAGVDKSTAQDIGSIGNAVVSSIKGLRVKLHSRLYRLIWDEPTSAYFYSNHYSQEDMSTDPTLFDKERGKYHLEYVGDVVSKGGTTSFLGINEDQPELMIRKACARAIDENVADLQKKYEQFRTKSPILSVNPTITAQIGLKEGISSDSKFEVLERQVKDGKTIYKRVGIIKPIGNMIWDNRFMAVEEGAYGANLGSTTFKKVSGGDFYPGMLIRQID